MRGLKHLPAEEIESQYPHLFQETIWPWGPTRARFMLLDAPPVNEAIASVNIVPCFEKDWIVIRLADGTWEVPGGTLEPGEDYRSAAHRELIEEAGAHLEALAIFGAWQCTSLAEKPYRTHLPHPHYFRIACLGTIKSLGSPTNPQGTEKVVSVHTFPLDRAVGCFTSQERQDLAELYKLAYQISGHIKQILP